jgi:hypothetical protein
MNIKANNCWADIWRAECERAAFHAAAMLRIARMYPSKAAILEIIRSAPRSPDEEQDPEASPFFRCARAARTLVQSWDEDLFRSICQYFCRLASMKPAHRAFLEASIAGVLIGADGF